VGNGEAYGRPRTEDFRLWEPVGSEASDVQVVFLLLAATPQRAPRECQIPWSGEGHREANDSVAMVAAKLPQRAVA